MGHIDVKSTRVINARRAREYCLSWTPRAFRGVTRHSWISRLYDPYNTTPVNLPSFPL